MHRLIANPFRMRPLLAVACLITASVLLSPAPATSQPVPPEPAPIPVPPEPEPTPSPTATEDLVVITGPTEANPGGYFIVSVKTPVPGDDVLVEVSPVAPDGASPPIELLGKQPGELVYLYQQVVGGKYVFRASAQVSVDKSEGFDPHDEDELIVTVKAPGPVPPGPNPPGPGPEPVVPDLKGFSLAVYNAAKGLDKATVAQAAGAYGSQVSAINAGAYNSNGLEEAKRLISVSIADANPPRQSAVALFDLIDGELQRREEAGQLGNLTAVSTVLAEITAGLEAVTK